MIEKILVTGSLGQIGSYFSEIAMQNGMEVVGLDNETNKCPNLPEKINKITIKGDICDGKLVSKILKDTDAIVHCAAQISVEESLKNPLYDAENNIIGTITLLQAAAKLPSIKRFVYISSAATYGPPIRLPIDEKHPQNPLSPYGISKLVGEKYVNIYRQIHKMPTVIIRPFNVYSKRADPKSPYSGVASKFIGQIEKNEPPTIFGDGKQTRDFIHAKDVVQMICIALERNEAVGEVFNCGCGKNTTLNQLVESIIKISGKKMKPIYTKERKGDIKHSYANIKKARKILKFKPRIDLDEGLKEMINSKD